MLNAQACHWVRHFSATFMWALYAVAYWYSTITLNADNRLNEAVFDTRLPADLKISWNAHLNTTAGVTYNSKITSVGEAPRQADLCCMPCMLQSTMQINLHCV